MRSFLLLSIVVVSFFGTAAQAFDITPHFCLAHVIYEEARGESDEGQLHVGFVTKIRSWHDRPDWGGKTICGVAGHYTVVNGVKRAQYQGFKDLSTWVPRDQRAWKKAQHLAGVVLRGEFVPKGELRYATYYLSRETSSLKGRCWFDRDLIPIARIGAHFFYREPLPAEAAALKISAMPEDCPQKKAPTLVARR